jgi:hypothetical protein
VKGGERTPLVLVIRPSPFPRARSLTLRGRAACGAGLRLHPRRRQGGPRGARIARGVPGVGLRAAARCRGDHAGAAEPLRASGVRDRSPCARRPRGAGSAHAWRAGPSPWSACRLAIGPNHDAGLGRPAPAGAGGDPVDLSDRVVHPAVLSGLLSELVQAWRGVGGTRKRRAVCGSRVFEPPAGQSGREPRRPHVHGLWNSGTQGSCGSSLQSANLARCATRNVEGGARKSRPWTAECGRQMFRALARPARPGTLPILSGGEGPEPPKTPKTPKPCRGRCGPATCDLRLETWDLGLGTWDLEPET